MDEGVLSRIAEVSDITKDDAVLEIGPGLGALTARLSDAADDVLAVEIDPDMGKVLSETMADRSNVSVVIDDILKLETERIEAFARGRTLKVVANLPYYITTPILMYLLESGLRLKSITVMVQLEVAKRLSAEPGSKDYGAITPAVAYRGDAMVAFTVPPEAFIPSPSVDSAVVVIKLFDEPSVSVSDEAKLFAVIKAAFAMRRKTLANALYAAGLADKERIFSILKRLGLSDKIRGEALSLAQFAALSEEL